MRRRRNMWSWDNMRQHRNMLHEYKQAYKKKLAGKKVSGDLLNTLEVANFPCVVFLYCPCSWLLLITADFHFAMNRTVVLQ